jgi:ParB/RepB/Spo0J family partition protein
MAVKRNGLGKGLDSLIPNKTVKTTEKQANKTQKEKVKVEKSGETIVKITQVEPNSEQPRKDFDEDALLELADSIKQFGVLQPLLVQKKNDYYEIIAGERRWRAAKLAGLKEVPVLVREYTEQEVVEISLIENIQRENLNPIEEAIAYKRLLKEFHLKQDEIAERVSKSRTAVTNSKRKNVRERLALEGKSKEEINDICNRINCFKWKLFAKRTKIGYIEGNVQFCHFLEKKYRTSYLTLKEAEKHIQEFVDDLKARNRSSNSWKF